MRLSAISDESVPGSELIAVISYRLQSRDAVYLLRWVQWPRIPRGQCQPIRGQDEVSVDQSEGCVSPGPSLHAIPPGVIHV